MHKKLNIAVVGLGIGQQHVEAVLENSNCELRTLVDVNPKAIEETIAKFGLKNIRSSTFDQVVADSEIDLVCVASFDSDHFDQTLKLLHSKKHVFVEKPLCQTSEQLSQLIENYSMASVGLCSNLVLRTSELFNHVRKLITDGQFGEIYAFDADYLYGRLEKITEGWRSNIENYSVMEGGGIHMIDLMLWLTGQHPASVSSLSSKIVTKSTKFRYSDFQSAHFSFANGMVGRITANFGCVHPHQHVVRIFGTKATFIYDDTGARIYWNREEPGKPEILPQIAKPKQKGQLLHNFIDRILKNDCSIMAKREFELMNITLTAVESGLSGKAVAIKRISHE